MDNVIFVALFAGLMLLALGYVRLRRAVVERIELPDQRSLVYTPPIADSSARVIAGAFAEQLVTALRSGELAAAETKATLAQIFKKLEPTPERPRYFITEPGIGYPLEHTNTEGSVG